MNVSHAVLTLWYISAPDPAAVLKSKPKADRGFGRKYLAQLNPSLPVTLIGQFPLNRSAQTDVGEFYIGGYPGVTVIQTVITHDSLTLSQLSPLMLHAIKAEHIYAFASNPARSYAGIAHWHNGQLKRSLCSTATEFIEDTGLPEPFEGPFWAGERPLITTDCKPADPQENSERSAYSQGYDHLQGSADAQDHANSTAGMSSLSLPFDPLELLREAERYWLGVDVGKTGPDLNVVGYAVDGRPEPKVAPAPRIPSAAAATSAAAAKLGLGPSNSDYDDYTDPGRDHGIGLVPAAGDAARAALNSSLNVTLAVGARAAGTVGEGLRRVKDSLGPTGTGLTELAAQVQKRALAFIKRDRR